MTLLPNILGHYEIRDSGWGYDEIMFEEEQDISEQNIDRLNAKILNEFGPFGLTVEQLDWRDPNTLWIHELTV